MTDPLNLLKTTCRISHTKVHLFTVPSQILILLLHSEVIASLGSSSSRMLEPWLNFKLIVPISMCLHLKHLSKFIPCLHSIVSMSRAPSHYDSEEANDDNMLS